MTINKEIKNFDKSCAHLLARVESVSRTVTPDEDDEFIAEAIAFRLFRVQERLIKNFFLDCCVKTRSPAKKPIKSKLRCKDWETAEDILKAGNRFLDWGNPQNTRNLANLIFRDGYPISDVIRTKESTLIDLQRIRNFIAHDSKEAQSGFIKTSKNYINIGDAEPTSAGQLLLYRRRASEKSTLSKIHEKISELSEIIRLV